MRRTVLALTLPLFAAPAFAQEEPVAPAPPPPVFLTGTAKLLASGGGAAGTVTLKDGN